jgi:hypothetical protein
MAVTSQHFKRFEMWKTRRARFSVAELAPSMPWNHSLEVPRSILGKIIGLERLGRHGETSSLVDDSAAPTTKH